MIRARWPWAFTLATVLTAIVWYHARADTIGVARASAPWLPVTTPPFAAAGAFALTLLALGVVPALLARRLLDRSAASLGLGPGDYWSTLKLLGVGVPIAVLAGYLGSRSPEIAAVYPLGGQLTSATSAFALHAGGYLLYYLGFEYLFRGFLLLGTVEEIGPVAANLLQACLATAFHFGKPGMEMAAAFPASLLFGWATLRTRSIWCALAVHWMVGVSLDWFLVFGG